MALESKWRRSGAVYEQVAVNYLQGERNSRPAKASPIQRCPHLRPASPRDGRVRDSPSGTPMFSMSTRSTKVSNTRNRLSRSWKQAMTTMGFSSQFPMPDSQNAPDTEHCIDPAAGATFQLTSKLVNHERRDILGTIPKKEKTRPVGNSYLLPRPAARWLRRLSRLPINSATRQEERKNSSVLCSGTGKEKLLHQAAAIGGQCCPSGFLFPVRFNP